MADGAEGLCGLLLAAGRSVRFGTDKLLHPLADGTAVAVASARAMQACMPQVIAVVNRDNESLRIMLEAEGIEIATAPAVDPGTGTSIATGVAASPRAAGWLVALADMPYVLPDTIARVLAAVANGALLAAPVYRGQRGHPVGFGAGFRDALLALRGDEGARQILRDHPDALTLIDCDDAGVVQDIDRLDDLRQTR
jgi:molybdenum cofactor cytidylyltransferase